jgi:hypothetical protein
MTEHLVYHQKINIPFRYTAGEATGAFLRGLADRTLLGSRCAECELILVPARPFCPNCSARTGERVEVDDRGELVSHTVERSGRIIGLIRLDGADTLLAHLIDADPVSLRPGMRVRARWAAELVPEIVAIEAFEPEP